MRPSADRCPSVCVVRSVPAAPDCMITGPNAATPNCFTDGIGAHGNNERCAMRATTDLTVSATQYEVEQGFDYLSIYIGGGVTRYWSGTCDIFAHEGTRACVYVISM
jgi:hypothetical protein